MIQPYFFKRDFTQRAIQPGGLVVSSAVWSAVGGPKSAELEVAAGFRLGLVGLLDLLRCPVELQEAGGGAAWWGYVNGFEIWDGRVGLRTDLDKMGNGVKVLYRDTEARTEQKYLWSETSWANDLASQSMYGIKEKIYRLPVGTLGTAEGLRNVLIETLGWPVVNPVIESMNKYRTFVYLKGWWDTLGWRIYNQTLGLVEHDMNPDGFQNVGYDGGTTAMAQSFTVSAGGWDFAGVWLKIRAFGSPADTLQVDLMDDSAGAPGVVRASATLAAASVPLEYTWVKFTFASVYAAAAGSWWVRVSRSGANDNANYFLWRTDDSQSYSGGKMRKWSGAAWSDRSPGGDGLFRVFGSLATTEQIKLAAAAGIGGQFLAGVRAETASGISTNPYREDNRNAKDEIEDLLAAGTSAGVRLLGEITNDRYMRIYAQGAAGDAELFINEHGWVMDKFGQRVPTWRKVAGEWCKVQGLAGLGSAAARISDTIFAEEVELSGVGLRIREQI